MKKTIFWLNKNLVELKNNQIRIFIKNENFITGGCGYIGSILTEKLLSEGHNITVFDVQWFGNYLTKHKRLKIIKDDVRNIKKYSLKNFDM